MSFIHPASDATLLARGIDILLETRGRPQPRQLCKQSNANPIYDTLQSLKLDVFRVNPISGTLKAPLLSLLREGKPEHPRLLTCPHVQTQPCLSFPPQNLFPFDFHPFPSTTLSPRHHHLPSISSPFPLHARLTTFS